MIRSSQIIAWLNLNRIIPCVRTVAAARNSGPRRVNFESLTRGNSPNDYLVCPLEICLKASPHAIAAIFDISEDRLRLYLDDMLANRPRSRVVFTDHCHLIVEERSAVFRFPDLIDIEIIAVGAARSTLAIYSRSKYGYFDFGVNKRRVREWLKELDVYADTRGVTNATV